MCDGGTGPNHPWLERTPPKKNTGPSTPHSPHNPPLPSPPPKTKTRTKRREPKPHAGTHLGLLEVKLGALALDGRGLLLEGLGDLGHLVEDEDADQGADRGGDGAVEGAAVGEGEGREVGAQGGLEVLVCCGFGGVGGFGGEVVR